METQTFEETLKHYGILGMKWGVRRSDKEIARANRRRAAKGEPVTPSEDAKKALRSKAKAEESGVEALSNDELKELNERLNLESSYERLTESSTEVSTGKRVTQTLLKEAGQISGNIARSEAQRILAQQVRKKILGG